MSVISIYLGFSSGSQSDIRIRINFQPIGKKIVLLSKKINFTLWRVGIYNNFYRIFHSNWTDLGI